MAGDRWDSWPTHASQDYLTGMGKWHDAIASVKQLSPSRYDVTLLDGTVVRIFMTAVYEFTVSDYAELRQKFPDVDCIVQAASWNHFTDAARKEARDDGVATFHFKGLIGALNFRDEQFLDYEDVQY